MIKRYYYSIASGSSGNCGVYVTGDTAILFDVGVSLRQIKMGLEKIKLKINKLAAILITHEHIDHVKGLPTLLKHYPDIPTFASPGTAHELEKKYNIAPERLINIPINIPIPIRNDADDVWATAFHTSHDAKESVGYRIDSVEHMPREFHFGYGSDMGVMSESVMQYLRGCQAVALESNYEPRMLEAGSYPYFLKKRISGDGGHLSNIECAKCAENLARNGTQTIILVHLSEKNNMPELALQTVRNTLRHSPRCLVYAAPRDNMEKPIILIENE